MAIDEVARSLHDDGVVIVDGVLSDDEITLGRTLLDIAYSRPFDPLLDAPGYSIDGGAAGEPIQVLPDGSRFVTNLVSKDPFFASLIDRPVVIDLVRSLLDDPILSSLNSLEPIQGAGRQTLHRDEGPVGEEGVVTVNTLWVFDDMDAANGATRYVPDTQATDELASDDDPRVAYAAAPAGSVIVMNAHLLHGASTNHDGRRRRVVHAYFTKRHRRTQTDWGRYVPDHVRDDLGAERRAMLGLT